jgi:hypothetical protein
MPTTTTHKKTKKTNKPCNSLKLKKTNKKKYNNNVSKRSYKKNKIRTLLRFINKHNNGGGGCFSCTRNNTNIIIPVNQVEPEESEELNLGNPGPMPFMDSPTRRRHSGSDLSSEITPPRIYSRSASLLSPISPIRNRSLSYLSNSSDTTPPNQYSRPAQLISSTPPHFQDMRPPQFPPIGSRLTNAQHVQNMVATEAETFARIEEYRRKKKDKKYFPDIQYSE